jgi:hypothetical protein
LTDPHAVCTLDHSFEKKWKFQSRLGRVWNRHANRPNEELRKSAIQVVQDYDEESDLVECCYFFGVHTACRNSFLIVLLRNDPLCNTR